MKEVDIFKASADDESFTVELDLPRYIIYEEENDTVYVGVVLMVDKWGIHYPDENEWESGRPVSDDDAQRIIKNIESAMHFMGKKKYVILKGV